MMIRNAAEGFVCAVDLQEKLLPAMGCPEQTLKRVKILLEGTRALHLPLVATEQYPKGLGPTLTEVRECFPEGAVVTEKKSFSCFGSAEFQKAVEALGRKTMILIGVETHVCVFQTALDALKQGLDVCLIEDCVDSRHASDKTSALALLRESGATVMTSEMLLFLLLGDSGNPAFKTISKLIR